MTTTLSPSVGAGIAFTQQGQGTSPGFSALDLRRSDSLGLQEGVYNASDFMVVQRGAGANMSVDIGMPAGGFACVQGDTISGQGLYTIPVHSATINESIAAADATNPRVDQIILEVLDSVHDGSGGNRAQTRVLTGTATAGATLNNRTGAVALPGNALLLADVLVGATATSITNTVIRDRRKWARGAMWRGRRSTSLTGPVGTTGYADDTTNLQARVECSGVPVRVTLECAQVRNAVAASGGNGLTLIELWDDGSGTDAVAVDSSAVSLPGFSYETASAGDPAQAGAVAQWTFTPSSGSHRYRMRIKNNSTTASAQAILTADIYMMVEEIVRQNSANNATTTG